LSGGLSIKGLEETFLDVLDTCYWCGSATSSDSCSCTDPATGEEDTTRLLGGHVSSWGESPRTGIIGAQSEDGCLTVVDERGGCFTIARVELFHPPQSVPAGWTAMGKLVLGALWWARSDLQRRRVDDFAKEVWDATPRGQRKRAADDLLKLGRADLLGGLDAPGDALKWIGALELVDAGEVSEAADLALELPLGRYPGKLSIFAAAHEHLTGSRRERALAALKALTGGSPERDAVIDAVRVMLLTADPSADVDEAKLEKRHSTWLLERAAAGEIGQLRALARLLGTNTTLRSSDLDLLDRETLDDLIDAQAVPTEVARGMGTGPLRSYALARLDPTLLTDDELRDLSLGRELDRRRFVLTPDAAASADLTGDDSGDLELMRRCVDLSADSVAAAVELLTSANDSRAVELVELRAGGGFPSEQLLEEPTLARFLLERRHHLEIDQAANSATLEPAQQDFLARLLLLRGRDALFAYRPAEAAAEARASLAVKAKERAVRAEAFSLLAAACAMTGDDRAASDAAAQALQTHPTLHGQINAAVTAQAAGTQGAVDRWAALALDASATLALRSEAFESALRCWFEGPADADGDQPPTTLVTAARSLAPLAIPIAAFRTVMRFLADHDHEWLEPTALRGGWHASTVEAKVYLARAEGLNEQITAMAKSMARDIVPAWLEELRDDLVSAAINGLSENDPGPGYVFTANHMLDVNLPMDTEDRLLMRALVARGVALMLDPEESEPADRYLEWMEEDRRRVPSLRGSDDDRTEVIEAAQRFASLALARSYLLHRMHEWQAAASMHDQIIDVLRTTPSWQLNMNEIRGATGGIVDFCQQTAELLHRLRLEEDFELHEPIDALIADCHRLADSAAGLA
jgi:hypothetical protein